VPAVFDSSSLAEAFAGVFCAIATVAKTSDPASETTRTAPQENGILIAPPHVTVVSTILEQV
jgi:hypothetical protein